MFTVKNSSREVNDWLEEYQQTVKKSAGNQQLKFTAEIWTTEEISLIPAKKYRVKIVTNDEVSFLDMEMSWSLEGHQQFNVFRKRGH